MELQHAAVIGHPIGHTMSPYLQQRLFALSGIPMDYRVMDVPEIAEALPLLRGLDCFNITIPHKTAILPYMAQIDEKTRLCGSVNTVRVKDGEFFGTTTDGEGCRQALNRRGLDFAGELLLLGNGGAARAILFEILTAAPNVRLTLVCRESSLDKCTALAKKAQSHSPKTKLTVKTYTQLEAEPNGSYDLLLNTTSVGMYPHVEKSPVTENVVARCRAVFDAVFNPRETKLLKLAQSAGVQTVEGMDMLVYQAAAAHGFWYGTAFSGKDLEHLCADARAEMEKLFREEA